MLLLKVFGPNVLNETVAVIVSAFLILNQVLNLLLKVLRLASQNSSLIHLNLWQAFCLQQERFSTFTQQLLKPWLGCQNTMDRQVFQDGRAKTLMDRKEFQDPISKNTDGSTGVSGAYQQKH